MKSIYAKLFFGFLISILLSFLLSGYIAFRTNSKEQSSIVRNELQKNASMIVHWISNLPAQELENVLDSYASFSDYQFYVYDYSQHLLYGNMKNYALPDILSQDSFSVPGEYVGVYRRIGNDLVFVNNIILEEGQKYSVILKKNVTTQENLFLESAFLVICGVFLTGSIVFLIISDFITKPITRLIGATHEISKGNYNVRIHYSGNDEIAQLNRSFNQMAQQLAKTEETRQQFISDVSHEFQTPLTAIQGFATILKTEQLPEPQRQKYADIILFQSKRLSTLAKNMLQLTVLDREDTKMVFEEYSLSDQLNRVISTQTPLAKEKGIDIETVFPKKEVLWVGDENRMEQVWINLINNAIKYTDENGVVTVTLKKTMKEVEVVVEDTGVGMSSIVVSHIFERFYREDKARSVEGNGLGLSIVKKIIDLHHGHIEVKSQEEVGSVFIVKLPVEKTSFNLKSKFNI